MAHGAEGMRSDIRQAFQNVQPTYVIPNRLHGAAHVTESLEFRPVVGHQRIGRSKDHEPALRELARISRILASQIFNYDAISILQVCGMEREDSREPLVPFQCSFWDEEPG